MELSKRLHHGWQTKIKHIFLWMIGKKQEEGVYYIGGSEILPAPLEEREEKACIRALGTTEEGEAREKLISHNLRLVVYLAI